MWGLMLHPPLPISMAMGTWMLLWVMMTAIPCSTATVELPLLPPSPWKPPTPSDWRMWGVMLHPPLPILMVMGTWMLLWVIAMVIPCSTATVELPRLPPSPLKPPIPSDWGIWVFLLHPPWPISMAMGTWMLLWVIMMAIPCSTATVELPRLPPSPLKPPTPSD